MKWRKPSAGPALRKYLDTSLKEIYYAAHCFGVVYEGKSIFEYGDVSICSFHATKIFHTAEGGAMFSNDEDLRKKLFYSHNFGHKTLLDFHGLGINGKMSELQAARGLTIPRQSRGLSNCEPLKAALRPKTIYTAPCIRVVGTPSC